MSVCKKISIIISIAFFGMACSTIDYQAIRKQEVDRYFQTMQGKSPLHNKVLSLENCIHQALENNLELRIAKKKEEIEGEKGTGAMLSMLPDLFVSYNGSFRDNDPGASSESLKTGKQSLEPSKSAESSINSLKVEAVLSVIDFGLAYFNSLVAEDKQKMLQEENRRIAQNLAFDVCKAYFNVAVAQYAMENTAQLLKRYQQMEANIQKLEQDKTFSPLKAVESKISVLRFQQQLREYERSYEHNRVQLATLMGYSPAHAAALEVDTTILNSVPDWKVPDIATLERKALENRPELFQLDRDANIALIETHKALLMMFPNVQIVGEFDLSSNKYLYNQSWWELGVRAAYNLLKLPARYQEYKSKTMEAEMMPDKILNVSIGVVAQVRMAYLNFLDLQDRYQLAEKITALTKNRFALIQGKYKSEGAASTMDLLQSETEAYLDNMDRLTKLANLFVAYHRMVHTVGTKLGEKS